MTALTLTPNHASKGTKIALRASGLPRYKMIRWVYGNLVSEPIRCSWSGVGLATLTADTTNLVYVEAQTRGKWALALPGVQLTVEGSVPVPPPPPPPPPPPVEPPPTNPPPTGTHLTNAATPSNSPPAVGQSILEAGVRLWAICDTQRHRYPLNEAWNTDGSKILLDFTSGSAHLHLGVAPYTHLMTLAVPDDAMWSPTDPYLLYGRDGSRLVQMDIRKPAYKDWTTLKDFGSTVSIGQYEGGISDNGRLALDAGGRLIVWDTVANQEVASAPLSGSLDGYQISRSGSYVVIRGGTTRVASVSSLTSWRQLDPRANHGAVCLFEGEDYYVGNNAVIGTVAMGTVAYRLSDGKATVLIPRKNAFEDGHTGHGGVVSNYDATRHPGEPGRDQIVQPHLDGTVTTFGFAHHLTPDANDGPTYRRQPHATLDRSESRALFFGFDRYAMVAERVA